MREIKGCFAVVIALLLLLPSPAVVLGAATDGPVGTGRHDAYEPGCGHLRGFIYKSNGEDPLWGAQVVLQEPQTLEVFRSNVTHSTGDYLLENIPAGNYKIHILAYDKNYKVKRVDFLVRITESKTTTISFSLKKAGGFFWLFFLDPCCEAAIIAGTALTGALIKKIGEVGEEPEQSPTER